MILTVTLNPMLDKTVEVRELRRGAVHRADRVTHVVGGKGVNVARQLLHLGVPATATGFWGGEIVTMLDGLLTAEGIPHEFVCVRSITREGVTYREPDGTWTAVFEPPHRVTREESDALTQLCERLSSGCSWIVCGGSSPCAEADDVYRRIVEGGRRAGIPVAVDAYGEVLRQALQAVPALVKMNLDELEASGIGTRPRNDQEALALLRRLAKPGTRYVILTDGPRAAYASDGKEHWKAVPPGVTQVNSTGSGDVMLAAYLDALHRGEPCGEAFRYGAAAGAANARVWPVAEVSRDTIRELAPGVLVTPLGTS